MARIALTDVAALTRSDGAHHCLQLYPQQRERESGRSDATERDASTRSRPRVGRDKPRSGADLRDAMRTETTKRVTGIEPATFSLGS